jgi:hypothetical protein
VAAALDAWAEAIRLAQADPASATLAEIFAQRCREARRGPGVLQVRSLANRGEPAAALELLERLLAADPQWQPLRSLREQLQQAPAPPAPQPRIEPPSKAEGPPAPEPDPSGFEALLARATARLQALGGSLPAPDPQESAAADLDALAGQLNALERRLSDYEARFALA